MDVPAAVSVVEQPEIQGTRATVNLSEPLNRVPGVFVQDNGNYAQDARIQIRGFGTRSAFGVREVKILVDGLPLTLPDGQSQLDDLDLGAVQRIEVLRGPASSLYGNASGGVIQFFTEDAPEHPSAEVRLTGGSYGLGKFQVKGGGQSGKTSLFVQGSYFLIDGYRDHSSSQSGIANAKLQYAVDEQTRATLLVNAVDSPVADDPGGLTGEQVAADRRQARDANVRLDAGEEVRQVRVGGALSRTTAHSDLSAYVYGLYRDFENRLPVSTDGIVTFHRFSPGGGARYSHDLPIAGFDQTLTVGFDSQYQRDSRRRSANVDGELGMLSVAQVEEVTSVGPYVRSAVMLLDDLEISGGVRYDIVDFKVDVSYPNGSPESGSRNMDAWSPGGGIRYTPRDWVSIYGNIGTAFQVPTTTELANPNGPGFNPAIGPQHAINYEIGSRFAAGDRATADVALFWIDIDDELIPFESPSGRIAYRNAGRSRRYGLEAEWQIIPLLALPVRWSGALTVLQAEYESYQVGANNFDGNDEPGIPPWQVYQELAYEHPSGVRAALEALFVGGYYVDDGNTARSGGYPLLNLRVGYESIQYGWRVEPFLGMNNLLGARYDGTVRLNAVGGRYYEPAPEFNVYGGIRLGWVGG